VTDEKTSRGRIRTVVFHNRLPCVDAITGDGAVCQAEIGVREAKPNEGMLLQNIPRQVTKHGCDFPGI
jgi:hypothetical protein